MNIKGKLSLLKYGLKAKSPELLLAGGIIAIGVAVYDIVKKAHHDHEILEDMQTELEEVKSNIDDSTEDGADQRKKAVTKVYAHTIWKFTKRYLKSAILIVAGVVMILGSHNIMACRNAVLTTNLAAATTQIDSITHRIFDDFGEEGVDKYINGITKKEIEIQNEDGTVTKTEALVRDKYAQRGGLTFEYEVPLGMPGKAFVDENQLALCLRSAENYGQLILTTNGFLFLNDLLKHIDLPVVTEGQNYGWLSKEGHPEYTDGTGEIKLSLRIVRDEGDYTLAPKCFVKFNVDATPITLHDFANWRK